MEVESKPVNESGDNPGDKKEEMTSADYYFDRYVTFSRNFVRFQKILVFSKWVDGIRKSRVENILLKKI